MKTWSEIKKEYDHKYGQNHHCLRMSCPICGNTYTCKCTRPKILEVGICGECSKKGKSVVASFVTADYPDHPDQVVISPKENFLEEQRPITEVDVFNYYAGVKPKMMEELKGRNIFLGIKPRGEVKKGTKPIYVRHPFGKKEGYITINNDADYEKYHSGRAVEIHVTTPQQSPFYVIDFDAGNVPFSQTKKIVTEIADKLDSVPEVKSIEIRYTGKRGFHVLGWLKKARDVNESREFLHGWLKEHFSDRDDVVFGESPSGKQGALGLTCMKVNAGQIAKWSLRISGQCCVEIPRSELTSFEHEDANIDKVYKKATGKTFSYGAVKTASEMIKLFVDDVRDAPSGWILAKTYQEAINLLKKGNVSDLSLDHDLGEGNGKEGYDILNWLEESVYNGFKPVPNIDVHSANPAGRARMESAIRSIYRMEKKAYSRPCSWTRTEAMVHRVINAFVNEETQIVMTPHPVKLMASRVARSFLKEARYDNEVFQPGYKGKFIIHAHNADKAGPHWDVRFQWPVTSVAKALHTYGHKGRGSDEPSGKGSDSPGSVYRSFVDKKMELPSGGKKIYLVETEDHPIDYEFEGEITEGYGKGQVKIFDKGKYELINRSKDRIVVEIHGKKVTGTFALIPFQKNYLWVKVKD